MFTKKILFEKVPFLKREELFEPVPAIKEIPDWYKNATRFLEKENLGTFKFCPPFLEIMKHGYVFKNHSDIMILREEDKDQIKYKMFYPEQSHIYELEPLVGEHKASQVIEMPIVQKWENYNALKYFNYFFIKTPPGYSSMFLNATRNDLNDDFYFFEAIVDTDKYHEVNFPFIINWSKIKGVADNDKIIKKYVFKKGEPMVTLIPFKRTNFKKEITVNSISKDVKSITSKMATTFNHFYRNLYDKIKFK